jgi:oxygen-dependent protoporphyrinogen oxidase
MSDLDVVIVGGGISGLSAARELCRLGLRVRLLERETRCGGVIQTDRVGDCVVDVGPDTLLAHKPAAIALCRDLGLEDQLVSPRTPRTTYVVRRNELRALPDMSFLGLPVNWTSLVRARAFSWRGKMRMALEALIPRAAAVADESVASFVGRRFGREAVTCLAQPLLAGIHRGDAGRLSMQALFPSLLDAERQHGSVIRAFSRTSSAGAGRGGSMSLRGGLGQLVERLACSLPRDVVITGAAARRVDGTGPFTVTRADGRSITATAAIVCTPPPAAARLFEGLDKGLAAWCGSIESAPSIMVILAYARDAVRHPLSGWGFVVPAAEGRLLTAVTWVSSKWPGRAPPHEVLIRASLRDGGSLAAGQLPDVALLSRADDELRDVLGITGAPVAAKVYRRSQAMPQLHLGHRDRIAAIEHRLREFPGLFISAAGFRGVGIPDCIADAQAVARQAADYVRAAGGDASS